MAYTRRPTNTGRGTQTGGAAPKRKKVANRTPRTPGGRAVRTPYGTGSTVTRKPPKNQRTIGQILDTHPLVKGVKSAAKFVGQVPLIEPIGVGRVLANRRKKAAEERAAKGRAVSKLGDENRAMARSLKKLDAANLARANKVAKDQAAKNQAAKNQAARTPKKTTRKLTKQDEEKIRYRADQKAYEAKVRKQNRALRNKYTANIEQSIAIEKADAARNRRLRNR